MASGPAKSSKMKRMESKNSHSWLWDSHITPKNNKWLQENLEEMDGLLKKMLKLIEEDADSFAKKAELYFKKRPELVNLVEEFYRMYRALAERYDLVSGELRKTMPVDLQSQSSGISEAASEPPPHTTPSPELRPRRSKSGARAIGFDVFPGSGSEAKGKEGDNGSTMDSDSESESESSVNNSMQSEENGLQKRVEELEAELEELKEKLKMERDEVCEGCKKHNSESFEFSNKIAMYEEELKVAKEKIQGSEEEIARLSIELQKHNAPIDLQENVDRSLQKIQSLEEELKLARYNLRKSDKEVSSLRQELMNMEEHLKSARNEVSKMSEENERLKAETSRMTKERTYLENKVKESDIRCQEEARRAAAAKGENEVIYGNQIRLLKVEIAEKDNCIEKTNKILDELRIKGDELNGKITALHAEIKSKDDRIAQMDSHLHQLHMQHVGLIAAVEGARTRVKELEIDVQRKQEIINEGAERKREAIRQLCFSLEHYRSGYRRLRQAVIAHKRPMVLAA